MGVQKPASDVDIRTHSADETAAVGAALGALAQPGDVLLLSGDLGAGKTTFTKAFGAALGVTEPITSPTFTLAREYHGRLLMHHLDVYRLERLGEVADLALSELTEGGGVVLIEWGELIASTLVPDYLSMTLAFGDGDDDRIIGLRCVGPRWAARVETLRRELKEWTAC